MMLFRPSGNTASEFGPAPFDWWPDWRGKTVAIVAAGPSAKDVGVEKLQGRMPVAVINESYKLCPWADVLYGCDANWWKLRKYVPDFTGLKITFDVNTAFEHPPIKWVTVKPHGDMILTDRPGVIGAGGCSGFQMLNLAVQFGANKILLIGYDMRIDLDVHWHGRHPPPLSNPDINNYRRWIGALDGSFERLATLGVEVLNCSPISALSAYKKVSLEEALRD